MDKFEMGDLVKLTEVAARIASEPARVGTVVGFGRLRTQVRVLWMSASRPQVIHALLLQHAKHDLENIVVEVRERVRQKQQPQVINWSSREDDELRSLLATGNGADYAARALSRTERAVRARARKLGLSSVRNAQRRRLRSHGQAALTPRRTNYKSRG